jgi:hypothetical protein
MLFIGSLQTYACLASVMHITVYTCIYLSYISDLFSTIFIFLIVLTLQLASAACALLTA